MPKPPEDDRFDDVIRQVSDALSAIGLSDDDAKDGLLAGVRDALHTLIEAEDDDEHEETGRPRVVVLDGHGESRLQAESPELRVVDTEEAERILGGIADDARVRVLHTTKRVAALPQVGRILGAWSEGERPWQTIYRGESTRPYRLACDSGTLELAVDGVTIERMSAGQTVDLEARTIRVRTAGTSAATGRYVRL